MRTKSRAKRKSHVGNESEEEVVDKQLEEEVTLGDVIWVKIQGDSQWPAQVVDENAVSGSNKTGKKSVGDVLVRLYGSYKYLYVDPVKCRSDFEMMLKQNDGSCRDIFKKALEQDRHHLKSGRSKGQGSKSTGAASVRITRTKKADVNDKHSRGSVSEKKGKPQHSAEKNNLVRVSPRRQLNATTQQSKANNGNLLMDVPEKDKTHNQDRVQKKLKQNSQSAEEAAKGKSSGQDDVHKKQGSVHKEIKRNSQSAKEEAKSKIHKQAEVQKKVKSNVTVVEEGRASKISKQDEGQNKLKQNTTSVEKGRMSKIPKHDEVQKNVKRNGQIVVKQDELNSPSSGMTSSGKSHELSARRVRVMQNLGLVAPSGSPFHKNGHINPSV